jgi:hypothetical protein
MHDTEEESGALLICPDAPSIHHITPIMYKDLETSSVFFLLPITVIV